MPTHSAAQACDVSQVIKLHYQYVFDKVRQQFSSVRDQIDLEAAVQDAFLEYLIQEPAGKLHFDSERKRRNWLTRVALNKACRLWEEFRKARLCGHLLEADVAANDDSTSQREFRDCLDAFIDQLPPPHQQILRLKLYEDKVVTWEDLAEVLRLPTNTVKTTFHRDIKPVLKAWWLKWLDGEALLRQRHNND